MAPERGTQGTSQAIERLTVLWIICTALILLALLALTLVTRGKLRQQADVIASQTLAIELLEGRIAALEQEVRSNPATQVAPRDPLVERQPAERSPRASEAEALSVRGAITPDPPDPASPSVDAARIETRLAAILSDSPSGPDVADPAEATRLLDQIATLEPGDLSGDVWARLAVVAFRLERDGEAESFAQLARQAGVSPTLYYELLARAALGRDPRQGVAAAQHLRDAPDAPPAAPVLLGAARLAAGDEAAASAALSPLPAFGRLASADRLLLAECLAGLERWLDLERVLADWRAADEAGRHAVNRLRARLALERGQHAVALAMIEHLLTSQPEDGELHLWRARALLRAGQSEAAREALEHPAIPADSAETWYWRGMLAVSAGDEQGAADALQAALRLDARHAAALEALGSLMLNGGQIEQAIALAREAAAADPRRASALFLLSLASARDGQREPALAALEQALTLDPNLAQTAKVTPAMTALISPDEIDAMVARARPE